MKPLILFVSLFCSLISLGQDQVGIANSNYAGTDGVAFAPGRAVYQWQFADIKVVGLGVNVWNNYVFLSGRQRSAFGELTTGMQGDGNALDIGRNLNDRSKKGSVFAQVEGPAFLLGLGRNAIGAHVTAKAQMSVSGVSTELGNFLWEGLNYTPQHGTQYEQKNLRMTFNAYTEFGGTFSRQLIASGNSLFSAGATIKYLIGHGAGGFLLSDLEYEVHDSVSLTIHSASGEYGFVEPAFKAGSGMGLDLGVHYQRTIEDVDDYVPHAVPYGCEPMPYHYRLSLSLLDLGGIKYQNAYSGVYDAAIGNIANYNELSISDVQGIDSLMRNTLSGISDDSEMKVGLATALAVQADLRVTNKLFLGLSAIQPIGGRSHMRIRRNAYLAAIPRFEMQRFEVAMPIVWREYQRPVVGLMFRLNSVVIGSDDLLPWISRSSNMYGADIYAKLKVTLFKRGGCKDRSPKAKSDVAINGKEALPCVLPK